MPFPSCFSRSCWAFPSWFKPDRECLAEALRAGSDREFEFAVDSFHYRMHHHHFCKRGLRIRLAGRKLSKLRR